MTGTKSVAAKAHPEATPATKSVLSESKTPATSTPEPKSAVAHASTPPPAKTRTASAPTPTPAPIAPEPKSIATKARADATPAAKPTVSESKTAAASTPEPKTSLARGPTPAPPKARTASAPTATPPSLALGPKSIAAKTRLDAAPLPDALQPTLRPAEFKTSSTRAGAGDTRYPWKTRIVTTVFWVGEPVGGNNFVHNFSSSWDANWSRSYGGFDNPNPEARSRYIPVKFCPKQNPFYIALPYNDVTRGTTKPEARSVIPWFKEAYQREGLSVCRDRWVAIRSRGGKVAYAQWSDCGPFRTDHWQYVFGQEKPKPNLNQGAGLDVSPAVRDYLGLESTDVTDWKFVDYKDVPNGPWTLYGENNPFTQKSAQASKRTATATAPTTGTALARIP
ncbi:MAG: hypothetical protein WCF18_22755 [Chthoniobacteraceae bacterium]